MPKQLSRIVARITAPWSVWGNSQRGIEQSKILNAQLGLLIPSLSTQPLVITQIVDRKNADEWAMALATLGCLAVAYVGRLRRRSPAHCEDAEPQNFDAAQQTADLIGRIRFAVRSRVTTLMMVPLVISTPVLAGAVVVRFNFLEWMCFFVLLTGFELYHIARLWKSTGRQIRTNLRQLAACVEELSRDERDELRERLGRRLFARLCAVRQCNSALSVANDPRPLTTGRQRPITGP